MSLVADRATGAESAPPAGRAVQRAPVLVLGVGSIGRRHLRNLATLGVPALALRTGPGQRVDSADWPVAWSWGEALAHEPDAVIIANPTALHVSAATAAADAGCHVLIEKPVAHALDGVETLRRALRRSGCTALVGYQYRFHPTLGTARAWIADGRIGTVVAAHAHWGEYLPGWHPDEDYRVGYSARADLGGGAVLTLSHPIDYLRWLLGEVEAASGAVRRRSGLEIDVEDVAAITLHFASGALGTVTLNYVERSPRHTLDVIGTSGTIRWNGGDGIAYRLDETGGVVEVARPHVGFERNAMFLDELRHFIACIDGVETPRCTLDDGVRAMLLSLAALQSSTTGQVVHV